MCAGSKPRGTVDRAASQQPAPGADNDTTEPRGSVVRAASSQPAPGAGFSVCTGFQPERPPTEADYWEETEEAWVRHHVAARKAAFTPVGVRGAPSVESLKDERTTILRDPETKTGCLEIQSSWKKSEQKTDLSSVAWVGETRFLKEDASKVKGRGPRSITGDVLVLTEDHITLLPGDGVVVPVYRHTAPPTQPSRKGMRLSSRC